MPDSLRFYLQLSVTVDPILKKKKKNHNKKIALTSCTWLLYAVLHHSFLELLSKMSVCLLVEPLPAV